MISSACPPYELEALAAHPPDIQFSELIPPDARRLYVSVNTAAYNRFPGGVTRSELEGTGVMARTLPMQAHWLLRLFAVRPFILLAGESN